LSLRYMHRSHRARLAWQNATMPYSDSYDRKPKKSGTALGSNRPATSSRSAPSKVAKAQMRTDALGELERNWTYGRK